MEPGDSFESRLRSLGFEAEGPYGAMAARIGNVHLLAIQHPFRGVSLTFTSVTPREATQYESFFPPSLSASQIASFISKNFQRNFRDQVEKCGQHFDSLNIRLEPLSMNEKRVERE